MNSKSKAINKLKLGEGSLEERRSTAKKANAQMRKKGTFYIKANRDAGLV